MVKGKILIFEAPWSDDIEDTQATRGIYTSAETLLHLGPQPVRVIQRPLVSSTYLEDIKKFVGLKCNQKGSNVIIFSAHGSHTLSKGGLHRRKLTAFDREINISIDIRQLRGSLERTIIILDACEAGEGVKSFRNTADSLGAIGFKNNVDWIDSSVFVLALLLKFGESEVFYLKPARRNTQAIQTSAEKAIKKMLKTTYKSFKEPLGIEYSFRRQARGPHPA